MEFKNPPLKEISVKANNHKGFTLSEVLITLVVIGVVAAITVPTLFSYYLQQVLKSSLEKNYSVLQQALLRYYADNGVKLAP